MIGIKWTLKEQKEAAVTRLFRQKGDADHVIKWAGKSQIMYYLDKDFRIHCKCD